MQTFSEFLRWEGASNDIIDFKKIYVDMAGDLIAGLVLSELVYWYLPSKDTGRNKLRVMHDGYLWIASRYKDWHDRARITESQAERAIKILVDKGLLIKAVYKFNGEPTVHVRIVEDEFLFILDRSQSLLQPASISVTTENEICQDRHPVTEITTKNTTKTLDINSLPQQTSGKPEPIYEEFNNQADMPQSFVDEYKPVKPPKKSKSDPRYLHIAYSAFFSITSRRPNRELVDTIIELIGDAPDTDKLRACHKEWLMRGYNQNSIKWLEWYRDGIPGIKRNEVKSFRPTEENDPYFDVVHR